MSTKDVEARKSNIRNKRATAWMNRECPGCRDEAAGRAIFDLNKDNEIRKRFMSDDLETKLKMLTQEFEETGNIDEDTTDVITRKAFIRLRTMSRDYVEDIENAIRYTNGGALPGALEMMAEVEDEIAAVDRFTDFPAEAMVHRKPEWKAMVVRDGKELEKRVGPIVFSLISATIGGLVMHGLSLVDDLLKAFSNWDEWMESVRGTKHSENRLREWLEIKLANQPKIEDSQPSNPYFLGSPVLPNSTGLNSSSNRPRFCNCVLEKQAATSAKTGTGCLCPDADGH